MNKLYTTLLTLATLGIALPGALADCTPTTSEPEVDTGDTPAGRFYVDNDACQPECIISLWVYQESNGMDGLQRGDETHDDTCGGTIESDTIIV